MRRFNVEPAQFLIELREKPRQGWRPEVCLTLPLPKAVVLATAPPIALAYCVPVSQLDYFSFTPQISDSWFSWFGADQYPQHFLINSAPTNGNENAYAIQPNLTAFPGNPNQLFFSLRIDKK